MQSQILHLLHFLRHAERKTFYLVDWRLQSSLWGWIKKNKFRLEHGCVLCPLFEFVWLKTILTSECSFSLSSILGLWGFSGFRPHPTLPHTQAHAHPAKQQIVTYRQKDTHTHRQIWRQIQKHFSWEGKNQNTVPTKWQEVKRNRVINALINVQWTEIQTGAVSGKAITEILIIRFLLQQSLFVRRKTTYSTFLDLEYFQIQQVFAWKHHDCIQ